MKRLLQTALAQWGYAITKTREGYVADLLKSRSIDHVVDVGANSGQFAGVVRRAGFRGPLTCFEPNPNEARKIPGDLKADVRMLLVTDVETPEVDLRIYASSDFASVLPINPGLAERYGFGNCEYGTLKVPAVTLDDQQLAGSSIYLKIDTQGSEAKVLRGGRHLLERVRVVQAELPFLDLYCGAPTASELLELLSTFGFRLTRLYPVTYVGECVVDADAFFERPPGVSSVVSEPV